ncbi:hypothetical protein E4K10_19625 [Streptomyces sp. T1317-0309]|nr:hypothetical protein E4K10_19625 [Streptomyces sp. T1317-0309]
MGERSAFLDWVNSEEHVQMVRATAQLCPGHPFSLRFHIVRETGRQIAVRLRHAPAPGGTPDRRRQDPPCAHLHRQAGSEREARSPRSSRATPPPRLGSTNTTRLCRTSLFIARQPGRRRHRGGGRPAHSAAPCRQQPEVRAVEEAINPYLEEERDLNDAEAARGLLHPCGGPGRTPCDGRSALHRAERYALHYPAGTAADGAGPAAGPAGRGGGGRPAQPDLRQHDLPSRRHRGAPDRCEGQPRRRARAVPRPERTPHRWPS